MKLRIQKCFIQLLFSLIFCGLNAQTLDHHLDEILNTRFSSLEPGASVLIAKKGKIIYQKSRGLSQFGIEHTYEGGTSF